MQKIVSFLQENIVSVLIFVFLAVIVGVFMTVNAISGTTKQEAADTVNQVTSLAFSSYDNTRVLGSEVIQAAEKYKKRPQFSILIKTGKTPAGFYALNTSSATPVAYTGTPATGKVGTPGSVKEGGMVSTSQMTDPTDVAHFVNKTATFVSKIYTDEIGEVRLIEFTQVE